MSKLFYILLASFCLSCEDPPVGPQMKNSKDMGSIDEWHKVMAFHDDVNGNTCYIVMPRYDSQSYSIACVKDEVAPSR